MRENIVFIMPPQGSSGSVPLAFLLDHYPTFADYYEQTKNYFKSLGYTDKEIFRNFSTPNETKTITSHPFTFFWSVAMASIYIDREIVPCAIIGHSLGEFATLVLAGYNYTEMLDFVTQRARLIDTVTDENAKGTMCHASLPDSDVSKLIAPLPNLSIAAINSKNSCVVSGLVKEIKSFEKICDKMGIMHKRLSVPHPAHSPLLSKIDFSTLPFPRKTMKDNNIKIYLSSCIEQENISAKDYPNLQAKKVANFYTAFSDLAKTYENPICVEFAVHSTLKNACLANGAKLHIGASALEQYIPNLPSEECFHRAIKNNLTKLRRLQNEVSKL